MKITKKGSMANPADYIGNKAVCKRCGREGEIQGSDIRDIKLKGAFKRPTIKCACGGEMAVEC